jgi:uncharacterized protein (DUF4415 family)
MSEAANKHDLVNLTFNEIAEKYGEEAAINAGIAADPDTFELDDAWFARARPASEVDPQLVEHSRRTRGKQKAPKKELVSIRLDSDIAAHFRSSGPGWQARLNDTLRRAVFGA